VKILALCYYFVMSNNPEDLLIEFIYEPAPDADDRLAQAWDLIIELIREDCENEAPPFSRGQRIANSKSSPSGGLVR
jgi:hypothetical protein